MRVPRVSPDSLQHSSLEYIGDVDIHSALIQEKYKESGKQSGRIIKYTALHKRIGKKSYYLEISTQEQYISTQYSVIEKY